METVGKTVVVVVVETVVVVVVVAVTMFTHSVSALIVHATLSACPVSAQSVQPMQGSAPSPFEL